MSMSLPEGFVYLRNVAPNIIQNLRYASNENFVGRPINGYNASEAIITYSAAFALMDANEEFAKHGYKIVIYDSYRPKKAVEDFFHWSLDHQDNKMQELYYPTIDKSKLFDLGYIAHRSGHSRGSTVDLSILPIDQDLQSLTYSCLKLSNDEVITLLLDGTVDMGSSFDVFHPISHHDSELASAEAIRMRDFLRTIMVKNGFIPYHEEWWHYTLSGEPFPDTYFDFDIV